MSRSFFTTSMAADCQATMAGELCETLATSGISEMEAQVRGALVKKDSEINVLLSKAVVGNNDGSIELKDYVDLRETDALAGQDAYAECAIDEFQCRVVIQKPLDRLPYERIGVMLFRCRVKGKGGNRSVSRTVEEARAFKIVLVAPPRPFDRYGLFLGQLGNVASLDAVNPARARLLDQLGKIRAKLDAGVAAQSGDPKERLLDILDDLPAKEGASTSVKEMGESQPGSLMFGLIPNFTEIDLGKLELSRSATEAADAADGMISALPADSDPALVAKAGEVAKVVSNALWSIWAFQTAFTIIPPNSPNYLPYKPFLGVLNEPYFARRAHYRIIEDEKSPNINDQLRELRKGGPLYGVIHVQSTKQVLELSGHYPGRVMFAVGAGGVKVGDVNKAEVHADRLTIAGFNGPVHIAGECHAHVITGGGSAIQLEKGAKIIGGLTVGELVPGAKLDGSVMRLEKYYAGQAMPDGSEDDYTVFTLILSPQILYRKVSRS